MPDSKKTNKELLLTLNSMLAANDRLASALDATVQQWPYVSHCWIDQMSEPTKLLAEHRVKPNIELSSF